MKLKVATILALLLPFVVTATAADIGAITGKGTTSLADQVRGIVCGTDECTPPLKERKTTGDYQLINYLLGSDGYGSATALVYLHDKTNAIIKVFSGFGANGQVLQATILNMDNSQYLELYEMTSKGNGEYELYRLNGVQLESMLQARGVEWHDEGAYYDGVSLKAAYPHMDGDRQLDVVLDGIVILTDEKTDKEHDKKECKRIFTWDAPASKFQERSAGEINRELCDDIK